VQRWEYLVWRVSRLNSNNVRIRYVDGERVRGLGSLSEELAQAGAQGWELVSTLPAGDQPGQGMMFFRRPVAED
jgi:hypothetical protein